jgi:hypothetical protein
MAQTIIYPYGTATFTIDAGEYGIIAAYEGDAKIYLGISDPNMPTTYSYSQTVTNTEVTLGTYSADQSVRVEAGPGKVYYNTGASPTISLPTSNTITGTGDPTTLIGESSTQGGAVAMTGGTSSTSANAGGAVTLTGGTPGATGVGGAVSVTGGAGGSTSGAGGATSVTGGAATAGNSAGGASSLVGGAGSGTQAGGAAAVTGGAGGATGAGGAITVTSGAGGATSGTGGAVTIASGTATADSASGAVTVQSGAGAASAAATAAGASGSVVVETGAGGANTGGATGEAGGAGGAVTVRAGVGGATNSTGAHDGGAGGSLSITAGSGGNATAGTGNGGAGGDLTLTPGSGGTTTGGTVGASGLIKSAGLFTLNAAQVLDMNDATVQLTVDPGTTAGTILTSNIMRVDPNSSGAGEDLELPPEADVPGLVLWIYNTGGENIVVKDDSGGSTIDTVATTEFGFFYCDGTAWHGMNVA